MQRPVHEALWRSHRTQEYKLECYAAQVGLLVRHGAREEVGADSREVLQQRHNSPGDILLV